MNPDEFEAVKAALLRHLEETEDDELQAALWQVLLAYDEQEVKLAGMRAGLVVLLEGTK
jgi:hypothetical protein